ncbi:MAG: helix-turn-helix domain-containing protein, partial [Solirubrobacterales bacterium]
MSARKGADLSPFGRELRHWRRVRGVSQLDLALEARTTTRHISFLETGRSRPSEEMVERLGEAMMIPLRERSLLMEAAGLTSRISETPLESGALRPFRDSLTRLLEQHSPYPAMVLDRHFDVVEANATGRAMLAGAEPPVNVVELTM